MAVDSLNWHLMDGRCILSFINILQSTHHKLHNPVSVEYWVTKSGRVYGEKESAGVAWGWVGGRDGWVMVERLKCVEERRQYTSCHRRWMKPEAAFAAAAAYVAAQMASTRRCRVPTSQRRSTTMTSTYPDDATQRDASRVQLYGHVIYGHVNHVIYGHVTWAHAASNSRTSTFDASSLVIMTRHYTRLLQLASKSRKRGRLWRKKLN